MIWLGRTLLLILAGMATLSIIGAIAAIPGNPATSPPGRIERPSPPPPAVPAGPAATMTADGTPAPIDRGAIPAAAPVPPDRVAEALAWLQPLTYAMIALAGFAAAMLVVLLRISARLGGNDD